MVRSSAFAVLLLCLVVPTTMTWAQVAKEVEINGFHAQYVEQGSGEPMVFVHGAPGDRRAWEPIREGIASKYRFIAYNQRYFGTEPWPDDGKNFSIPTLADDLATFITSFNAGPVHLVSWSFGGLVAMQAAVKNPSLVRSLILYEPNVISVLPSASASRGLNWLCFKMSTIMGRVVIRQRSPVRFSSSCRSVEQSTLPHLDVRVFFLRGVEPFDCGIVVEATKFELVINRRDRQDP